MKYEEPNIEIIILKISDITTLSNDPDEESNDTGDW